MSDLSQEGRIGKLTTPAGQNTFVLNRFEGDRGARAAVRVPRRRAVAAGELRSQFADRPQLQRAHQDRRRARPAFQRRADRSQLHRRPVRSVRLSAGAAAVAAPAVAHLGLPHLLEHEAQQDHHPSVQRPRLHRFPREPAGGISDARIHRAVPRDRPQFRLPVDGEVRHLLLFRAHPVEAHAGALRRPRLPRENPFDATGAVVASDRGGPARSAAVRFLVERARVADRQGRAQRLFLREAGPGSARQGRQARILRAFDAGDLRLSRRLRQQERRREMGQGARRSRAGAGRPSHRHRQRAVAVSRRQVYAREQLGQGRQQGISGAALHAFLCRPDLHFRRRRASRLCRHL